MSRKFKIIGVGSPLLDVLAHVSDEFLAGIPGEKGGMELIDADQSSLLISDLGADAAQAAGGSAGNTIFGLAELGIPCTFLGKLGQDLEGDTYLKQSLAAGVDTSSFKRTQDLPTGKVCCMVTPDSERTFRTYLGAASALDPAEITVDDFAKAEYAHLEGYLLFNRELAMKIMTCAKEAGCKISLDLASFEVVQANADVLESMLTDYVDIVFANEEEAKAFTGSDDPILNVNRFAELCTVAAVKVGAEGAYLKRGDETVRVQPVPANAMDTTGAGDLWATGFLFGYVQGRPLDECGRFASQLGAEVVQILGADIPKTTWNRLKETIK
jgi:sugar/nucleoside kinase (ribokinase family)